MPELELGRKYTVPHIRAALNPDLGEGLRDDPSVAWWPVAGEEHEDGELLRFPLLHVHVDWRFVSDEQLRRALIVLGEENPFEFADRRRLVLGRVITRLGIEGAAGVAERRSRIARFKAANLDLNSVPLDEQPALPAGPRAAWRREFAVPAVRASMPSFVGLLDDYPRNGFTGRENGFVRLGRWARRRKLIRRAGRLICPHRGYDVTDVPPIGGIIECPLHGLCWDARTGTNRGHFEVERVRRMQRGKA